MSLAKKLMVLVLAVLVVGLWVTDVEAKRKKGPKIATGPLDDGKLDPTWFGEGLEFREAKKVDYLWVKEGFSMDGHKLHFLEWPSPEFIGEDAADRDGEDQRLASHMARDMPEILQEEAELAFKDRAGSSLTEGDVEVHGRIVDCSTGNVAAKVIVGFGAGAGNTTIDLKFVDKKSGELLLGLHHRVVSGTTWSTTDSKFTKWAGDIWFLAAKEGWEKLYQKGKAVDE